MSGNAIDVPVILQPWGFVAVYSIVAQLYFIFLGPSGMSSGPFGHHILVRGEFPSAASTEEKVHIV